MTANFDIYNSKILIIDDEISNIRLLEKTLESAGFNNYKSEQKSKKFTEVYHSFHPDLLLLDLRMPAPDGFQIMQEINANEDIVPPVIMVLTAEDESVIRMKALSEGANDFLSKPFDYTEVILRIKNILKLKNRLLSARHQKEEILNKKARELARKSHDPDIDLIQCLSRANRVFSKGDVDNYIRVSHYSHLLAKKIGLSEQRAQNIKLASSTYDIGMIAVPLPILNKKEELSLEEWEIMKSHTTIGADLLSGSDSLLMKMARQIALQHHEKWNGKGYPHGMKREEISLEARIVSIADQFDSMTRSQDGNAGASISEGLAFLKKRSSIDFDPSLVASFLEMAPNLKQIKEKYKDNEELKGFPPQNDFVFKKESIQKIKTALPVMLKNKDEDKLLLVDDIPTMRSAYRKVARQLGYSSSNIIEASSGPMALRILKSDDIHLMITDLYMPQMSGLELVTTIRETPKYKNIPVIVVSEENRKDMIMEIIRSGASQYLLKPFTSYQLEEKINQVLFSLQKTAQ
ncbi:MAG: response regulator [Candidatus Nitrohelix vancouverensis]|uniref:Response regulator n=1 Tax=Candidatus Nitrohelix vancouverensis TaxID=2705534 RepID=A0A7T0G327_9BACT|nr:MAG: response regulator [Candidatus Nitrohelix vancouverensis]